MKTPSLIPLTTHFSILFLAAGFVACGSSNFRGGAARSNKDTPVAPVGPVDPTSPTPTAVPGGPTNPDDKDCVKRDVPVGLDIVFMVDNSGSNAIYGTDCPDQVNGVCQSETNRSKAVREAVNILRDLESKHEALKNHMSIVSLPDSRNMKWDSLVDDQWLGDFLSFTKTPNGYTPYNQAFSRVAGLLSSTPKSDPTNEKFVVLLSDGESTDTNPKTAEEVRAGLPKDTKIAVFMLTSSDKRSTRLAEHAAHLRSRGGYSENAIKIITDGQGLAASLADKDSYFEPVPSQLADYLGKEIEFRVECK